MIKIKIHPIEIENIKQLIQAYYNYLPKSHKTLIYRGIAFDLYQKMNKINTIIPKEKRLSLKPQEAVMLLEILSNATINFPRESAAIAMIISNLHQQIISYNE